MRATPPPISLRIPKLAAPAHGPRALLLPPRPPPLWWGCTEGLHLLSSHFPMVCLAFGMRKHIGQGPLAAMPGKLVGWEQARLSVHVCVCRQHLLALAARRESCPGSGQEMVVNISAPRYL